MSTGLSDAPVLRATATVPGALSAQLPTPTSTKAVSSLPNIGVQGLDGTVDGKGLALIVVATLLLIGGMWLTVGPSSEGTSDR